MDLVKIIEGLITENDVIKSNAMSAIIATQSDHARSTWNRAKAENNAYLKVLNLIKESEDLK